MIQHINWAMVREYASFSWNAVGPLAGVLVGAFIANRNQRKNWLLDNKRSEYRKLLTTISDAGSKFIVFYGAEPVVASGKQQFAIGETARKSVDVIYNRLFIADRVIKLNIEKRWEAAISALRKTHDINAFGKTLDTIMHEIRTAALEDLG